MFILEMLKTILLGIVEGITEWLPVSSTGHMILLDEFISLNVTDSFKALYLVVIQLGAIAAVAVVFWKRLNPFARHKGITEKRKTWNLIGKTVVGVIPAAIIGFFLDDLLETYLYNYVTVAITLIVYGLLFIGIENINAKRSYRVNSVEDMSYADALAIGGFQILSLIPGTSRSGSTILGGMVLGISRTASAEFSFFMAIPVMLGASLLKVAKFSIKYYLAFIGKSQDSPVDFIPAGEGIKYALLLVIGMAVAYLVSLVAIKFLMSFVKKNSFSVFGAYRIILGAIVGVYFIIKTFALY